MVTRTFPRFTRSFSHGTCALAFLPKTLNQFASRWKVFDKINADAGVQGALSHCSFHSSKRRSVIVTKNFASIRSSCDTFTFPRSLSGGRTSCGIPHQEGAISQSAMCSGPAILKTNGQSSVLGVRGKDCLLVSGVTIALDSRSETSAKHRCRRADQ